jgi:hypothetical protein
MGYVFFSEWFKSVLLCQLRLMALIYYRPAISEILVGDELMALIYSRLAISETLAGDTLVARIMRY